FLTTPRSPCSTLFPYTTLFRSTPSCRDQTGHAIDYAIDDVGIEGVLDVRDAKHDIANEQIIQIVKVELAQCQAIQEAQHRSALRSEEHTSELQSLAYLVCRLLL